MATYNIGQWLRRATDLLDASQVPSAHLDALILLEDALGRDRSYLLAHPEDELSAEISNQLEQQLLRRAGHEPLAYIRGKSEFYGREFHVTPATLQPRSETETMIAQFMRLNPADGDTVADIGTGSGCIAVTLKLELPNLKVMATEINTDALEIAKANADKLGADIDFYEGNLIEPIANQPAPYALLCNLPYVPDSHTINQAAMQEPSVAIFGGGDGLDLYRELFRQMAEAKNYAHFVLTESLPFQHEALAAIAEDADYILIETEDLIQVFKHRG